MSGLKAEHLFLGSNSLRILTDDRLNNKWCSEKRQVPDKWNVMDTTTIYTVYMYMICYSFMFVVCCLSDAVKQVCNETLLEIAPSEMPVSGSTFLVFAWYSWFLRNISGTQDYSQYIWECKGKSEDKTKTSKCLQYCPSVEVSPQQATMKIIFLFQRCVFPWAMKSIWCHLDVHSLDNFTCVSVQKSMSILAVNSYNRLFHFTKTWGLEDFWPSECPFDSRRQHYLYWAIVPLNKNGARWFLLMALQKKFP